MTSAPEDDRNLDLAEAVNDILEYATSRLTAYREATGREVDFHLVAIDGDMMETAGAVSDFDRMADAFFENVSDWAEAGKIGSPAICDDDIDDDELFTATFDPARLRPS